MEMLDSFDFDMSSIVASIVFGIVGMWLLRKGKKEVHYPYITWGLILMMYPYFVTGPVKTWGLGFVFCTVVYFMRPA